MEEGFVMSSTHPKTNMVNMIQYFMSILNMMHKKGRQTFLTSCRHYVLSVLLYKTFMDMLTA